MNLQHRKPKIYYNDNPRKALQFHSEVLMFDEYDNKSVTHNETSMHKDIESINITDSTSKVLANRNTDENPVEAELISECISETVTPDYKTCSLVVDIPVIISQFKLKVYCQASVELDSYTLEIKRTKKNVFLSECKLFPTVNKLFIAGFIRNNIEYASVNSDKDGNINTIRHITTSIPFKCSTLIEYIFPPVIDYNEAAIEIEIVNEDLSGNDILEKAYVSSEYFNEKINCKLISAEVTELISGEAGNVIECEHTLEKPFKTVTDKLAVNLVIKLIQNQQIKVNL